MDSSRIFVAAASSAALLMPLSGCATQSETSAGPVRQVGPATQPSNQTHVPTTDHSNNPAFPAVMRLAWRRWAALDEDDYELSVQLRCFCPQLPTVVTSVRDGKVVQVTHSSKPEREIDGRGWTMERLYRLLRTSYATAYSVQANYTAAGVPNRISIDSDTHMADEEQYFKVSLQRR